MHDNPADASQQETAESNHQPRLRADRIDWPLLRERLRLTGRQADVVQLVVEQGLTSYAIGRCLGISERTVTTHLAEAYKRYNVHSRAEIVSIAWSTWMQMVSEGNATG